ncbi:MAG: hypothetical protein ING19_16790, partial [Azospirillum sp.]|nr:hypothetical protein [Azospirillum sp.]
GFDDDSWDIENRGAGNGSVFEVFTGLQSGRLDIPQARRQGGDAGRRISEILGEFDKILGRQNRRGRDRETSADTLSPMPRTNEIFAAGEITDDLAVLARDDIGVRIAISNEMDFEIRNRRTSAENGDEIVFGNACENRFVIFSVDGEARMDEDGALQHLVDRKSEVPPQMLGRNQTSPCRRIEFGNGHGR